MIKHQNSHEVKQFIHDNKELFWSIHQDAIEDINHDTLVEYILNYGDIPSIKKMFDLLGIENVANIFYKQINYQTKFNRKRNNYFKLVRNFFDLYFKRHVPQNTIQRTK